VLVIPLIHARSAPVPKPAPVEKKETPKTVKFAKKEQPWTDVFAWLAETTGKPVNGKGPTGTFTLPEEADKEYTIPEVIDVINEALLGQNPKEIYYLLNGERSFAIVPADEKIDLRLLPVVRTTDLGKHRKSELVVVVHPLQVLNADDVAPQIRKLMGPFGQVIPVTCFGFNDLIMIDTVANLADILEMLATCDRRRKREDATPTLGSTSPAGSFDPRVVGARP
jgi:hypothetical protein